MLALSHDQLRIIMDAADSLPIEKRGIFLEHVVARLDQRGSRITAADLDDAMRVALRGLVHRPHEAA